MKPFNFVLLLLIIIFSANSLAGGASGKVTTLYTHAQGGNGEGVVMFAVENRNNPPACSIAANGHEWAFSLEAESGKAMLALLLSAEARDMPVIVAGFDDCVAWNGRERPKFIRIVK